MSLILEESRVHLLKLVCVLEECTFEIKDKMEDYLVYEVSKHDSPYTGFGYTTDPSRVIEEHPDHYFRPLFGFYGTEDDCKAKVSEYMKSLDLFIYTENFTTVYLISCLDPLVTKTYVGQTNNFKTRVNGHIDSSCVKGTKVYDFIRMHGWWNNWTMKPLGEYLCDSNSDDARRLEWFWWKKTKSTLNTQTPGKKVVDRDRSKLKLSEEQLFQVYETFERVIHRDYTGTEELPCLSRENVLYIDCKPKKPIPVYKRFTRVPVMYTILNESVEDKDTDSDTEMIELPEPEIQGNLFLVTNEQESESYLGITMYKVTEESVLKTMHSTRQGKLAYLYMTLNGGWSSWKFYTLSNTCDIKEYTRLSKYLVLNNLTCDHPYLKSFTY